MKTTFLSSFGLPDGIPEGEAGPWEPKGIGWVRMGKARGGPLSLVVAQVWPADGRFQWEAYYGDKERELDAAETVELAKEAADSALLMHAWRLEDPDPLVALSPDRVTQALAEWDALVREGRWS